MSCDRGQPLINREDQSMAWKSGESGNPKGRPPKSRALTAILETAGKKSTQAGDNKVARQRLLAQLIWEMATEGKVTFPDGRVMVAELQDWMATIRWLYGHVDGSAGSAVAVGVSQGSSGSGVVIYIPENGRDTGSENGWEEPEG